MPLDTAAVLRSHPQQDWLTSSLLQELYSQTMEALDHMLQSFMIQSPTANELHFLLSVRASGSWGTGRGAQLWPESPKEDIPQEARLDQ